MVIYPNDIVLIFYENALFIYFIHKFCQLMDAHNNKKKLFSFSGANCENCQNRFILLFTMNF